MFLIDLFFRNKPWLFKKQIHDDQFGMLWYNSSNDPQYNHYQGHFRFKPTNDEVDIFIDSSREGISANQKEFFTEIEQNYLEIELKAKDILEKHLCKKLNSAVVLTNFRANFNLCCISLGKVPHQSWSLTFASDKYSIMGITVKYIKRNAISIV